MYNNLTTLPPFLPSLHFFLLAAIPLYFGSFFSQFAFFTRSQRKGNEKSQMPKH